MAVGSSDPSSRRLPASYVQYVALRVSCTVVYTVRFSTREGYPTYHRRLCSLLGTTLEAPQNPLFETKTHRTACPLVQPAMFHGAEAKEQARLLLQLAQESRPNQGLKNVAPGNTGNVQPSPPLPPAATTLPPLDPPRNPFATYRYRPLQTHGIPSEQQVVLGPALGGEEALASRRQEPNLLLQLRMPMQQQYHEPMLAMAVDARSNHTTHHTSTSCLNRTSFGDFDSLVNNNLLYTQSSNTSSISSRANIGKLPSHSAGAFHRAHTAMSAHANTPAPAYTYNLSRCLPVSVGQPMPPFDTLQGGSYSNRFQTDPSNSSPSEEAPCGPSHAQIAARHSINDKSNERASTRIPSQPLLSSGKQYPPPQKTSWMYNIETAHPSPSIQATEKDDEISASRVIPPDTKTKRTPIREEDVTRYDILSGRGGEQTNVHVARSGGFGFSS
jgi:hypothetical protein